MPRGPPQWSPPGPSPHSPAQACIIHFPRCRDGGVRAPFLFLVVTACFCSCMVGPRGSNVTVMVPTPRLPGETLLQLPAPELWDPVDRRVTSTFAVGVGAQGGGGAGRWLLPFLHSCLRPTSIAGPLDRAPTPHAALLYVLAVLCLCLRLSPLACSPYLPWRPRPLPPWRWVLGAVPGLLA